MSAPSVAPISAPGPADLEALRKEVEALRWWHRIDLGNGIVTPGHVDTGRMVQKLHMPDSLAGKTVLDIGAWDGFYSFEAERRGASRVLALDWMAWGGGEQTWGSKAGFDLAHRVLGSKVETRLADAMQLDPNEIGMFDLVLYLGVLYHMRHPQLALERVFSVTREMAIVETQALLRFRKPMLEFYPGDELFGDPTNWFAPNAPAIEGMLKTAGFRKVVQVLGPTPFVFRAARGLQQAVLRPKETRPRVTHGRLVYHAYR